MDRTTVGDFGVARPRMSDHADAGWSGREQDGRPIENLKYLYDLVIAAARGGAPAPPIYESCRSFSSFTVRITLRTFVTLILYSTALA